MKPSYPICSARILNEVIKTSSNLKEIKEVASSFISNMNDYSSSDQAFVMAMLGLKMMRLAPLDKESLAAVVGEYGNR